MAGRQPAAGAGGRHGVERHAERLRLLGQFESGAVAALFGTEASVVIGGAGTLLVAALWIKWFPALWQVDRLVAPEEPSKR